MYKNKILITWHYLLPLKKEYKRILKKEKISYDIKSVNPSLNEIQLLKIINKYDGIICGDDEISKKVIDKAKRLKVISKWGTGLNSINVNYAKKKGIKVYNSPKAFVESVSVYTFGLLINLARGILNINSDVLEKKWPKYSGIELKNKKIGIFGYGNIGKKIASIGKSLEMNVLINDINLKLKNQVIKKNLEFVSKKKLLNNCDFIILATDLNKTSYHLLSSKEFKQVKKGVIIINISRGPTIDENALNKSLKSNKIGGLGLDVFEHEPLKKNSPIRKFKNKVLSSHNAFNTREAVLRTNFDCINNLVKGLRKR
tara:strand:+ start:8145 stop:9086 length:942 start_codon:yes stop_codon:yes gene_type:complete